MRRIILIIYILCFAFNTMHCEKPKYEIKAYSGTYFLCWVSDSSTYPSFCGGIILENDSTQLDTENEEKFYLSLFNNAVHTQDSELFYAEAYNIIFPNPVDRYNNYALAEEFRMNFYYLFDLNEKCEKFKLSTGRDVKICFCNVKGLFLSVYDDNMSKQFCTSMDVQEDLLPPFESVNIPIVIFSCSESNHKFNRIE